MIIAVDAMGGDFAPATAVEGAVQACKKWPNLKIVLIGKQSQIQDEFKRLQVKPQHNLPNISIQHCTEVIEMGESPVSAIRRKKDSSILVGANLVKQGEVDALVSAGNTGAAVAASTLRWRLLPGVDRPGIALIFPSTQGASVLIDAGANIDSKPKHYHDFAVMGKIYGEMVLGVKNPKIGLLNIGEEDTKGGASMKEVFQLFKTSNFNFIGNVEGRDIFNGTCDVIVCDGFVGNITLKVAEGVVGVMAQTIRRSIKEGVLSSLGGFLCRGAFKRMKKRMDYAEYGGAPLLGVNGTCIISHGSSSAKAICNAISVSQHMLRNGVNERIVQELSGKDQFQRDQV